MATSARAPAPSTLLLGLLVLDRRGRLHDADPAVAPLAAPALRQALVEAARALAPDAWSERVLRVGGTAVRARVLRERKGGRVYALLGVEDRPRPLDLAALTPREREVARRLGSGRGRSDAAVARALRISVATLRWHLTNILRKTGLAGREDLRAAVAATRS